MKRTLLFTFLLAGMLFGTAQAQTADVKVSPTGARYKIIKDAPGRTAQDGDMITFNFALFMENDSMLFSTFTQPEPINIPLEKPKFGGDFMDNLMQLSKGDSANFWISVDSMRKYTYVDSIIKPGTYLRYTVKVLDLMTDAEFKAKQKADAAAQVKKDDQAIQAYLKKNKLKAQKTASGLYYVIEQAGTGENAKPGQTVSVHYTGTLLDGKKFDSSVDRNQPYTFVLGRHQVIQGWDEGIALLNKGAKAKLLIPSALAYGQQANGPIPANSVLIFDVQLMDVHP